MAIKMNIYVIRRRGEAGYDAFDSAVVIASSVDEARRIHPGNSEAFYDEEKKSFYGISQFENSKRIKLGEDDGWVNDLSKIDVEYIGEAKAGSEKGVILASFNAG
jgi:phage terminase Nu1 subunit (DNA packaging protein)